MSYTQKRRSPWLAVAGAGLALLLGPPGAASAACTPPVPTIQPGAGSTVSQNPPGEIAVQTCSPFAFRDIGRRH